jgi:hypothetical protein
MLSVIASNPLSLEHRMSGHFLAKALANSSEHRNGASQYKRATLQVSLPAVQRVVMTRGRI